MGMGNGKDQTGTKDMSSRKSEHAIQRRASDPAGKVALARLADHEKVCGEHYSELKGGQEKIANDLAAHRVEAAKAVGEVAGSAKKIAESLTSYREKAAADMKAQADATAKINKLLEKVGWMVLTAMAFIIWEVVKDVLIGHLHWISP